MSLDHWDEVRTAYHVARLGTVSGAAEALGVHHATVIRHIDALEKRLGAKLFQRHARGYTPTEAGQDLMAVAQATEDQFTQLAGRIRGRGERVAGELIVTSLPIVSPLLTPALAAFQAAHEGLTVRFLTDERLFRLEYGEAHVAVRAGAAPEQPDNVVQPFVRLRYALYAARGYAERHGLPRSEADLAGHRFVGEDGDRSPAPFLRWLRGNVPPEAITWRTSSLSAMHDAVRAGAGIGFLPVFEAQGDPRLVEVLPPRPDWAPPLWLVTHVDLHRTAKVQAFLAHLKEAAKAWTGI
ncbi:MAG: LysR family transcriptional regulator [Rhodobacteraceae bacterium]|nr:LysR family transcriptional regulator [Paracoccaceae bacterium]